MATEKEANLAREQHSKTLLQLGAHSIGVDEFDDAGQKTFGVVAFMHKKPDNLPTHLSVKSGNQTFTVPLIAKVITEFKPE